ncbi:MAG: VapC toxin family PIN domain ribonuclease, partial [Cyanobium sp.]
MSATADLPDLNVWLALIWPGHIHHQQAVHYWEQQAAEQVLFCTLTALGLVRLVCQPKLMGTAVRTTAE